MPVDPLQLFAEELVENKEFRKHLSKAGVKYFTLGWGLQDITLGHKNIFRNKKEFLFKITLKKELTISGQTTLEKRKEAILKFKGKIRNLFNNYFKMMGKKVAVGLLIDNQIVVRADGSYDRKGIWPKYAEFKDNLDQIFMDIKAETLIVRPMLTDAKIQLILPAEAPDELRQILNQNKTYEEKDYIFSEVIVPVCMIRDLNFVLKKIGLQPDKIDEYIYEKNTNERHALQYADLSQDDIGTYGLF